MPTEKEIVLLKEVDLENDFKDYIENGIADSQGIKDAQDIQENILNGLHKEFNDHRKYSYEMVINDNLDICVRFDPIETIFDRSDMGM